MGVVCCDSDVRLELWFNDFSFCLGVLKRRISRIWIFADEFHGLE